MSLILNKYETTFRLALWALDEPLEFFENKSQLSANDKIYYKKITSKTRKKEWLAVRVLLNEVLGFWPHITYTESGKPLLQNHTRHLSVSHSKSMVGILLCTNPYVGIDIEKTDRNIDKVSSRFLSEIELVQLRNKPFDFSRILYWCAKEAIFKAVSESNVLFSKQIFIDEVNDNGTIKSRFISKKEKLDFVLNYTEINKHMVVWTT
ncbi:MAG: 4'-phosphopantetheinyl transferase superfamily protein [Prolixibacteraceae bacterium]|jgi:4'-phosphopantetheinyl transferase|nr:4'-phosphopantetheinyl transferase superfamily protein [Prolixibacteraceae bacterium]